MNRRDSKALMARIDEMLGEASWLVSHAEALTDYGRTEADAEWERAALCEEQVACLLEAAGRIAEAAVHRVSAATCYERQSLAPHAVTLLRAALSTLSPGEYRSRAETQLVRCLDLARKQLSHVSTIRK